MKTDLKNSGKEHQYLLDRLKRLEKHQKRIAPRAKVRTDPWQKSLFDRKAKNLKSVTHRIDYEPHREKEFEKTTNLLQRQADIELDPCTFNPDLNPKSLTMAQAKDHIIERDVPERYKRSVVEEKQRMLNMQREEDELAEMRIPEYQGRKPAENFYVEKFEWKNKIKERSEGHARENYDKEVIGMQDRPILSKNTIELANRRYNGDEFLQRVPKVIENKEILKKKLEHKHYNYTYKPTLYKPYKKGQATEE